MGFCLLFFVLFIPAKAGMMLKKSGLNHIHAFFDLCETAIRPIQAAMDAGHAFFNVGDTSFQVMQIILHTIHRCSNRFEMFEVKMGDNFRCQGIGHV